MANKDFFKPTNGSQIHEVIPGLLDLIQLIVTSDWTGAENIPEGAIRINVDNARLEIWQAGVWNELFTLYEIKVRNSDQLNGQDASFYLNAGNINTGSLSSDRIASLDAGKVSGELAVNNIPLLSASKINSGTFGISKIPTTNAIDSTSTQHVPTAAALKQVHDLAKAAISSESVGEAGGLASLNADGFIPIANIKVGDNINFNSDGGIQAFNGIGATSARTADTLAARDENGDLYAHEFMTNSPTSGSTLPDSASIAVRLSGSDAITFKTRAAIKGWIDVFVTLTTARVPGTTQANARAAALALIPTNGTFVNYIDHDPTTSLVSDGNTKTPVYTEVTTYYSSAQYTITG